MKPLQFYTAQMGQTSKTEQNWETEVSRAKWLGFSDEGGERKEEEELERVNGTSHQHYLPNIQKGVIIVHQILGDVAPESQALVWYALWPKHQQLQWNATHGLQNNKFKTELLIQYFDETPLAKDAKPIESNSQNGTWVGEGGVRWMLEKIIQHRNQPFGPSCPWRIRCHCGNCGNWTVLPSCHNHRAPLHTEWTEW